LAPKAIKAWKAARLPKIIVLSTVLCCIIFVFANAAARAESVASSAGILTDKETATLMGVCLVNITLLACFIFGLRGEDDDFLPVAIGAAMVTFVGYFTLFLSFCQKLAFASPWVIGVSSIPILLSLVYLSSYDWKCVWWAIIPYLCYLGFILYFFSHGVFIYYTSYVFFWVICTGILLGGACYGALKIHKYIGPMFFVALLFCGLYFIYPPIVELLLAGLAARAMIIFFILLLVGWTYFLMGCITSFMVRVFGVAPSIFRMRDQILWEKHRERWQQQKDAMQHAQQLQREREHWERLRGLR
jgi:hypothetical protein